MPRQPNIPHEPSPDREDAPRRPRRLRRGLLFLVSGPIAVFEWNLVRRNGRIIGGLASAIRRGPGRHAETVLTKPDRSLDIEATAFRCGVSVAQLEGLLVVQRLRTKRAAYLAFALGCGSVLRWIYQSVSAPSSPMRWLNAVQVLFFCLAFFLVAFRYAFANWQIRTRRLGSAGDYLRTTDSFWPS